MESVIIKESCVQSTHSSISHLTVSRPIEQTNQQYSTDLVALESQQINSSFTAQLESIKTQLKAVQGDINISKLYLQLKQYEIANMQEKLESAQQSKFAVATQLDETNSNLIQLIGLEKVEYIKQTISTFDSVSNVIGDISFKLANIDKISSFETQIDSLKDQLVKAQPLGESKETQTENKLIQFETQEVGTQTTCKGVIDAGRQLDDMSSVLDDDIQRNLELEPEDRNNGHVDISFETLSESDFTQRLQQTHLGVKSYRCKWSKCGFSSALKGNTMRHIRNVHLSRKLLGLAINAWKDSIKYLEVVQN